jgi:hypothetical protein
MLRGISTPTGSTSNTIVFEVFERQPAQRGINICFKVFQGEPAQRRRAGNWTGAAIEDVQNTRLKFIRKQLGPGGRDRNLQSNGDAAFGITGIQIREIGIVKLGRNETHWK